MEADIVAVLAAGMENEMKRGMGAESYMNGSWIKICDGYWYGTWDLDAI